MYFFGAQGLINRIFNCFSTILINHSKVIGVTAKNLHNRPSCHKIRFRGQLLIF